MARPRWCSRSAPASWRSDVARSQGFPPQPRRRGLGGRRSAAHSSRSRATGGASGTACACPRAATSTTCSAPHPASASSSRPRRPATHARTRHEPSTRRAGLQDSGRRYPGGVVAVLCIARARHVERIEYDALLVVSLDRLLPALLARRRPHRRADRRHRRRRGPPRSLSRQHDLRGDASAATP